MEITPSKFISFVSNAVTVVSVFCILTLYLSFLCTPSYLEKYSLSNPSFIATVINKYRADGGINATTDWLLRVKLDDKAQYAKTLKGDGIVAVDLTTENFYSENRFKPGTKVILTRHKNVYYMDQGFLMSGFIWRSFLIPLSCILILVINFYIQGKVKSCSDSATKLSL